jgi:hypothetical protein
MTVLATKASQMKQESWAKQGTRALMARLMIRENLESLVKAKVQ